MKPRIYVIIALTMMAVALVFFLVKAPDNQSIAGIKSTKREKKERSAAHVEARLRYEFDMLKDPVTGKIPEGIFEQERAFARMMPERSGNDAQRPFVLNQYIPAGPNNIGGRTRAVAYDLRFNGAGNSVIIAGCVSGGIMRSTDAGNSWTLVTPQNDLHTFTALAQDPRPGFQDTWYAGGGEFAGNSAADLGASYLGFGIWKSIDNGASWTKLTLNITDINGSPLGTGSMEAFDHPFDIVHRIRVNPVNGHVYIAGHRRLVRSTDAGTSFNVVLSGSNSLGANSANGQLDVVITNAGRVFATFNGGNPDPSIRGVWVSATGNAGTYARIAGGQTVGVDSVPDWRGNSPTQTSKRILINLAPSDHNIAYIFYENGLSSDPPTLKPEADLYRLDISGNNFTWSNRSLNMPDFAGGNASGSDPLTVQNGYDMMVEIHPANPDIVFVGGTNLYRSTDGFTSQGNTSWINGYQPNFTYTQYPNGHADIHNLAFSPVSANRAICANDGGIQETQDITAGNVAWQMMRGYQTLQCYNVAIDPGAGRNNFASGSQDNGVRFRDKTGVLGTAPADSNNHRQLFSADGAYVGISIDNAGTQYIYESIQLGRLYRARLSNPFQGGIEITPTGLTTATPTASNEFGEFVTNLRLEADNSDNLYYVNFNRLFRTTSASTVTTSGWTEMTGVSASVNPSNPTGGRNIAIRGIGFTRGPYTSNHSLYLGTTNGKIFRLDNPQNAAPGTIPSEITPPGLSGNVQDIAVNPNDDNEIIAVVSNYNVVSIWWTKNAKALDPTWKNAEGNLTTPSARSCAIVVKKDANGQPVSEYYVGTSVGLYSTTDLANTQTPVWQREGGQVLNYAVVVSLSYRPTDNVMLLGTHGNGLYYTNLGTPNFVPPVNTGITPVTNDRNFIKAVFPTVTSGNEIRFEKGNMAGVKQVLVELHDLSGRSVFRKEMNYANGNFRVDPFAAGTYILSIYSDNRKYRHIQKIIKQ